MNYGVHGLNAEQRRWVRNCIRVFIFHRVYENRNWTLGDWIADEDDYQDFSDETKEAVLRYANIMWNRTEILVGFNE